MNDETKQLIKEMKAYRDGMVARNLPFQWISDIITKWEMKQVMGGATPVTVSEKSQDELEPIKDFYEETQKEQQELEESYKESVRQTKERKDFVAKAIDGYGE